MNATTMIETMEERVIRVIRTELKGRVKEGEIVATTRFIEDLSVDSLQASELFFAFEQEFDREIPDKEAAEFKTVSDVVKQVNRHVE